MQASRLLPFWICCTTAVLALPLTSSPAQAQDIDSLRERLDQDRIYDPQSTVQDWVNPGALLFRPAQPAPALTTSGKQPAPPPPAAPAITSSLTFTGTMTYDTNAFRNSLDQDDWHLDYESIWALKMPYEGVTLKPAFVFGGGHYFDFDQLSSNSLAFRLMIEPDQDKDNFIKYTIVYSSQWDFTEGFDEDAGNVHTPGLRLGHSRMLRGAKGPDNLIEVDANSLAVNGTAVYQFADVSTKDALNSTLAVKLQYRPAEKVFLSATIGGAYRNATNFPGNREIWQFKAGAGMEYVLYKSEDGKSSASFKTGVTYTNADDSRNLSDYDQVTAFAALTATF